MEKGGMMTSSISGNRLMRAKFLKNNRLKGLAASFEVSVPTIQKWQQNGIPERKLSLVAHHFDVEGWVFTDENLSKDDFEKIILNPKSMDTFRQVEEIPSLLPEIGVSLLEIEVPLPETTTSLPEVTVPPAQCLMNDKAPKVVDCFIKNNLPQPDINFVGRNQEIENILGILSIKSRAYLISITGVGGVGKSSLTIEVAHRCLEISKQVSLSKDSDLYFDAFVWTSAKRTRFFNNNIQDIITVKSNLEDIVSEIIRVVDPDKYKNIPDQTAQYEYVLHILSTNRVLLIVDNLESVEDDKVISFLNELPGDSKAIITDRRSVQSSRAIRLLQLPEEEAASLIKSQCKNNNVALSDEKISELIEKTGGIPLAIVWAIGQMGTMGWGIDSVFSSMAHTASSRILEFLFEESFKHIKEISRQALKAFSIVDDPLTGIMIKDWLSYGTQDAQDAISELIQYALISTSTIDNDMPILQKTYKILPLVRNFTMNHDQGNLSNYYTSERLLLGAIDISKNLKNSDEITSVLLQKMTKLLVQMGELDKAEVYNRDSYAIECRFKRAVGIGYCKLNFALIAEQRGNLPQSLEYANEAADIFFKDGSEEDITEHLNRIRSKAAGLSG